MWWARSIDMGLRSIMGTLIAQGKWIGKKKGMDVDMSTYGHTNWRVPGFGKADGVAGTLILITSAARHWLVFVLCVQIMKRSFLLFSAQENRVFRMTYLSSKSWKNPFSLFFSPLFLACRIVDVVVTEWSNWEQIRPLVVRKKRDFSGKSSHSIFY
jgi:hypothetical protein